jgi:glycogen operon protein
MLAMLLLSEGTPMLLAGDEIGNTQLGNNNAYCQDNDVGWLEWQEIDRDGSRLTEFVRRLIALRRAHPVFRRTRFFRGAATDAGLKDITWIRSDSGEIQNDDWHDGSRHALGALFGGETGERYIGASGYPESDSTFLMLMNAGEGELDFVLPQAGSFVSWELVLDTAQGPNRVGSIWGAATAYRMPGRSLALFRAQPI